MTNIISHPRRRRSRFAPAVLLLVALPVACGGDDADDTVSTADWVANFDELCARVMSQLSASTAEEEFVEVSQNALAELRAFPDPDEMREQARTIIEVLEEQTDGTGQLDQARIDELDAAFLDAARALGVSEACIGGTPG